MTEDIVSWGVRTHRINASAASHWRARLRADPTVAELIRILTPVPEVASIAAAMAAVWVDEFDEYAHLFPPTGGAIQAAVDDVLDEYSHLFPPQQG